MYSDGLRAMHSLDVKYRAIVHYERFLRSLRRVAAIYSVSKSTLSRWVRSNPATRAQRQTRRTTFDQRIYAAIRDFVQINPAVTLADIQTHLRTTHSFSRSMSSIQRTVKRAGVTRKRLTQIADARSIQFDAYDAQREIFNNNIDSVVSIDETCFYSTDHSRYGYSVRGKRARTCVNRASMSRTKVSLLLATTKERIIGFQVYTGTCNSAKFAQFIRSLPLSTDATLLMDNVAFHKTRVVREEAQAKGATLFFTPPYSPWYNPVETTFSILKHRYRRAKQAFPTVTSQTIIDIVTRILPECPTHGSFTHVQRLLGMSPTDAQMT